MYYYFFIFCTYVRILKYFIVHFVCVCCVHLEWSFRPILHAFNFQVPIIAPKTHLIHTHTQITSTYKKIIMVLHFPFCSFCVNEMSSSFSFF